MGLLYTEIVQRFLEFEARPPYLLPLIYENQGTDYVKKVISALMKLEHDLEDTAIAPMLDESCSIPEIQVSGVASAIASTEDLAPSVHPETAEPRSITASA